MLDEWKPVSSAKERKKEEEEMNKSEADTHFQRGLNLMKAGNYRKASECFDEAIRTDRSQNLFEKKAKYLSYYGLCLALGEDKVDEGLSFCKKAIRENFFQADFYLNLGKVYLKKGSRGEAIMAFRQGLQLDKNNAQIKSELERLDKRGQPFFFFLSRNHLFNKYLGILLARLRSK